VRARVAGGLGRGDARPLRRQPEGREGARAGCRRGGPDGRRARAAGRAGEGARAAVRLAAGRRVGDRGRGALPAPIAAGDDAVTQLEEQALDWLEPHWNAEHLRRTRDWLLELEPEAGEGLRLAALLHDIERMFPGGPAQDLSIWPNDD